MALDPLVGAVAAGCAVVIKPSEIAPATSAFLAKFIPMYMDKDAIRVVEGGVQQITALLDQKWDKIFFTGSTTFWCVHFLQKMCLVEACVQLIIKV